jgi:hypothetical protein
MDLSLLEMTIGPSLGFEQLRRSAVVVHPLDSSQDGGHDPRGGLRCVGRLVAAIISLVDLLKYFELMLGNKGIVGRIEAMANLSDHTMAVMSLLGDAPVVFLPAQCVTTSVLSWIMLIGITVTE